MSLQNKYNRTPKEPPKRKGSSEVVSQMIQSDEETAEKEKPSVKKATFLLSADLHKQLRTYAAVNDTTMVRVVEQALKDYLNNQP